MKKSISILLILCFAIISISAKPSLINHQTVFKTPQAVANALYAAWRTKNKAKAKLAADYKAIDKLFSTNFIVRRKFAGCEDESETEKGLFVCIYKDPTDDLLNVAFETVKKGKYWRVRWVTFAAEN